MIRRLSVTFLVFFFVSLICTFVFIGIAAAGRPNGFFICISICVFSLFFYFLFGELYKMQQRIEKIEKKLGIDKDKNDLY